MKFYATFHSIYFYNFIISSLKAKGFDCTIPSSFGSAATASSSANNYNHLFVDTTSKMVRGIRGNMGSPTMSMMTQQYGKHTEIKTSTSIVSLDDNGKELHISSFDGYNTKFYTYGTRVDTSYVCMGLMNRYSRFDKEGSTDSLKTIESMFNTNVAELIKAKYDNNSTRKFMSSRKAKA